jgi:hypothetical protein
MWQLTRVAVLLALLTAKAMYVVADDSADKDGAMLTEVLEWATQNGAYINPKIESRHIVGDLSGIFAKEPMEKGEIVSTIPWDLIVKPPGLERGFCEGVKAALAMLEKDTSERNPYERYLASRPKSFHPIFWTLEGRTLLRDMMGRDLPPKDVDFGPQLMLDRFGCYYNESDLEDDLFLQALMLAMTRTEGDSFDHLVPFNDLINHASTDDEYTADPKYDVGTHYQIVMRRDVKAGEEIRNSYNKCEWCQAFHNSPSYGLIFVTPMIFEHYGFIEAVPQRWIVPSYRLLFDVVQEEGSDGLKAKFAIPPSPHGLQYLQKEIERLQAFSVRLDEEIAKHGIPEIELNTIQDYWKAILAAYKAATEEASQTILNDEVWYRHCDYWWEEPSISVAKNIA